MRLGGTPLLAQPSGRARRPSPPDRMGHRWPAQPHRDDVPARALRRPVFGGGSKATHGWLDGSCHRSCDEGSSRRIDRWHQPGCRSRSHVHALSTRTCREARGANPCSRRRTEAARVVPQPISRRASRTWSLSSPVRPSEGRCCHRRLLPSTPHRARELRTGLGGRVKGRLDMRGESISRGATRRPACSLPLPSRRSRDASPQQARRPATLSRGLAERRPLRAGFLDEVAAGGDLRRIPKLNWTLERKLGVIGTICAAVTFAHEKDIIHRDLKPANVLLTAEFEPILADFDIADLNFANTQTAQAGGSPFYAAPEQLVGRARCDATADVYSLGRLIQFMLTEAEPEPFAASTHSRKPCGPYSGRVHSYHPQVYVVRRVATLSVRSCAGRGPGSRDRRSGSRRCWRRPEGSAIPLSAARTDCPPPARPGLECDARGSFPYTGPLTLLLPHKTARCPTKRSEPCPATT